MSARRPVLLRTVCLQAATGSGQDGAFSRKGTDRVNVLSAGFL